jgi:hypothetical protein
MQCNLMQVQDLIVIRCLMNICHVSSLHSGSDRQSGASSNEEPETLAAVLSLCSGAKSARIREEACGMIQVEEQPTPSILCFPLGLSDKSFFPLDTGYSC